MPSFRRVGLPKYRSFSAPINSSRLLVKVPLNWILSLNAPTCARSTGSNRSRNCSAARLSSFRLAVMLALVSSITTALNGCESFENSDTSAGLPLSRMEKSARSRSGTRRPAAVDHRRVNRDGAHGRLEDRLILPAVGTADVASTAVPASKTPANTIEDNLFMTPQL